MIKATFDRLQAAKGATDIEVDRHLKDMMRKEMIDSEWDVFPKPTITEG